MDYRSDLTGLRALAVAAVVLFHFGVPGFSGGFAGVDVFFVISGYLMTGIVAGGMAAGRFSLSTFYLSRAKRIIPALAVLCLILLAAPASFWSRNPLSQAIGKWSYSIYLWHWPIFVAAAYFGWERAPAHTALMVAGAVGLGYLSYRFVEEPCRHSAFARTLDWKKVALLASPAILLGLAGIVGKGLPARLPPEVAAIETEAAYQRGNPLELCDSVQLLDPLPYLCTEGSCGSVLDGRPLYYDDDHPNEFGNRLLVRMMRGVKEFSGAAGAVVENGKQ